MVDWDKRYKEGFYNSATEPHELLKKFWQIIPKGYVVDIAMGSRRDAIFLAKKGFDVYGIERSLEAIKIGRKATIEQGCNITAILGNASALPFKKGSADGLVIFYFLMRDIVGSTIELLKKDGILIYETFLKRQNLIDRWRNPDYLLEDGELIVHFQELDLIFYEETTTSINGNKRAIAQYVGRKK